jgi:hypothetical protein
MGALHMGKSKTKATNKNLQVLKYSSLPPFKIGRPHLRKRKRLQKDCWSTGLIKREMRIQWSAHT